METPTTEVQPVVMKVVRKKPAASDMPALPQPSTQSAGNTLSRAYQQRVQSRWEEHLSRGIQKSLKPSAETLDGIADRAQMVRFNLHMLKAQAWGMVKDWYEAFALGRKNCIYHAVERSSYFLGQETGSEPTEEDALLTAAQLESILPGMMHEIQMELYFWDRCAQIYTEEMKEAERLAAEARERIAQRIESEFDKPASGVPEALRKNNPQDWAFGFDWN